MSSHNPIRRILMLVSALVLALGLAACGDEGAGQETGADVQSVVNEAVADLESQISDLETRIGELENQAGFTTEGTAGTEEAVGSGVIEATDADQYVGEQVTVSGNVSSTPTDNAFTLGADDVGGQGLLVVSAQNVGDQALVETGANVQVQGTVREGFNAQEVATELGIEWTDPEALSAFEGENYLVAESISEAQESETQG